MITPQQTDNYFLGRYKYAQTLRLLMRFSYVTFDPQSIASYAWPPAPYQFTQAAKQMFGGKSLQCRPARSHKVNCFRAAWRLLFPTLN